MNTGTGCGYWAGVFWGQSQAGSMPVSRVHDYLTKPRVIVIKPRPTTDNIFDRPNVLTISKTIRTSTSYDRPTTNISQNRPRSVQ